MSHSPQQQKETTYSVVGLNEGVVDGNDVDAVSLDAVDYVSLKSVLHRIQLNHNENITHALRKTWEQC